MPDESITTEGEAFAAHIRAIRQRRGMELAIAQAIADAQAAGPTEWDRAAIAEQDQRNFEAAAELRELPHLRRFQPGLYR